MINLEDFGAALARAAAHPVAADVLYFGREDRVTYAAVDFGKIRFPVRKMTLHFEPGTGGSVYLGGGKSADRDKRKVRGKH